MMISMTIMRKTIKTLFPMLLLVAGILVLSGCSKDDDKSTDNTKEQAEKVMPANPLLEKANGLNDRMAGLNFQELQPLEAVVPSSTRADDNSVRTEFETKLSELLTLLQGEEASRRSVSLGRRFSFQAFNTALELAWDLTVILGNEGESDSSWFGLNSTKQGEVNYTARNGSQYTVKGTIDKEVTVKFRGFKTTFVVTEASEFYILKDGEQVLKILSGSENNRPVWLPVLIKDNFFTGQLTYLDYEINLTYDKNSTHSRTVDLVYGKVNEEMPLLTMSAKLEDDADLLKIIKHDVNVHADFTVKAMENMLTFTGTTDNVNYLVVHGIQIAKCMEEGTTEQECKDLVEKFNANLTLNMMLSDLSVGRLYMGTVYDSKTNRYFPTVMIHSTMLCNEDYPLTTILQMLGVEIPEILRTVAQIAAEV
jgi:hypothetical protein